MKIFFKKKHFLWPLVVGFCLLVSLFFLRTFDGPNKYYQHTLKKFPKELFEPSSGPKMPQAEKFQKKWMNFFYGHFEVSLPVNHPQLRALEREDKEGKLELIVRETSGDLLFSFSFQKTLDWTYSNLRRESKNEIHSLESLFFVRKWREFSDQEEFRRLFSHPLQSEESFGRNWAIGLRILRLRALFFPKETLRFFLLGPQVGVVYKRGSTEGMTEGEIFFLSQGQLVVANFSTASKSKLWADQISFFIKTITCCSLTEQGLEQRRQSLFSKFQKMNLKERKEDYARLIILSSFSLQRDDPDFHFRLLEALKRADIPLQERILYENHYIKKWGKQLKGSE